MTWNLDLIPSFDAQNFIPRNNHNISYLVSAIFTQLTLKIKKNEQNLTPTLAGSDIVYAGGMAADLLFKIYLGL